jgi:hypothetical protein
VFVFSFATDDAIGAIVGVFTGTEQTDADYQRSMDAIEASDRAALARGLHHVCILVTDHDTPRPAPAWRQRMAASNDKLKSARCFFAVVSPSVLIRGVFTAIQWIMRKNDGRNFVAYSSFAEAAAAARKDTGLPLANLEGLYAAAKPALSADGRRSRESS